MREEATETIDLRDCVVSQTNVEGQQWKRRAAAAFWNAGLAPYPKAIDYLAERVAVETLIAQEAKHSGDWQGNLEAFFRRRVKRWAEAALDAERQCSRNHAGKMRIVRLAREIRAAEDAWVE